MKRALLVMIMFICACRPAFAGRWQSLAAGQERFTCVMVTGNGHVLAGTDSGMTALSRDGGATWKKARCAGPSRRINAVCFDSATGRFYAAADTGIFASRDGAAWKRVFVSTAPCLSLAATGAGIYCATPRGLVFSPDGDFWKGKAAFTSASSVVFSGRTGSLFCLAGDGLYSRHLPGGEWEKVISWIGSAGEAAVLPDQEGQEGEEDLSAVPGIIAVGDKGLLVLAVEGVVSTSCDDGRTWQTVSPRGAPVRAAAVCNTAVLIARKDVLFYSSGIWEDRAAGLAGARVKGLAAGGGRVFAASDKGLFVIASTDLAASDQGGTASHRSSLERYLKGEPDIRSVQKAAVAYADANPEKITRWRRQARSRAWLPHFTVGLRREVSDLWHWESGSTTRDGDDSLRKGRDTVCWDVGLTWELGELVWSDDQTSIDSRSKLNTELRNEVLDEVNRLYFEHARLALELESLSIEDGKKRREKQVRMEEISASLDGLTDGAYSAMRSQSKRLAKEEAF